MSALRPRGYVQAIRYEAGNLAPIIRAAQENHYMVELRQVGECDDVVKFSASGSTKTPLYLSAGNYLYPGDWLVRAQPPYYGDGSPYPAPTHGNHWHVWTDEKVREHFEGADS